MKRIFRFIILALSFNASAQEMSNNMVAAEEDDRNGNGYYTSYSAALQNLNDVKNLDIQKEDSDQLHPRRSRWHAAAVHLICHSVRGPLQ